MPQNAPIEKFRDKPLSVLQETAVNLIFEGELTREEIALRIGVDRKTLYRWQSDPRIQKRLLELQTRLSQELGVGSFACALHRMSILNSRCLQANSVISQRAEKYKKCPDPDFELELASGFYKKRIIRRYRKGVLVSEQVDAVLDSQLYRILHDDHMLAIKEMGGYSSQVHSNTSDSKHISLPLDSYVVGYAHGGIKDAIGYWLELRDVGRLPTNAQEVDALLIELDARETAKRHGKKVPPLAEVYNPALELPEE